MGGLGVVWGRGSSPNGFRFPPFGLGRAGGIVRRPVAEMQQDPSIRGAGRYRLLHLLSLDELGSVWAAEDSLRRHRVTVRRISNPLAEDPGFRDRVPGTGRGL